MRDRRKINSRNPGAPSEHGASLEHSSWDQHLVCLNTRIIPLCREDGGRIGQEALSFIDSIASAAGFSQAERLPWTIFWKQRLHITSAKGVARVIRGLAPFSSSPASLDTAHKLSGLFLRAQSVSRSPRETRHRPSGSTYPPVGY